MKYLFFKTVLSCLLLAVVVSCRKPEKDVNLLKEYTIKYTGSTIIGNTLVFNSDIPPSEKIEWKFKYSSDKSVTSSFEISPRLMLQHSGTIKISIIVNGDIDNVNKKNPSIWLKIDEKYDPEKVKPMITNRNWKVYQDTSYVYFRVDGYGVYIDTIDTYSDAFAIIQLSDSVVRVKDEILRLKFAVDPVYVFEAPIEHGHYEWERLFYYAKEDSIIYTSHPYQGGRQHDKGVYEAYGTTTTYVSLK